jgi:uncharacterized membrane protein
MSAGKLVALWGICVVVFFALDFAWLSFATTRVYQHYLGALLAAQPKLGVAAVFYLIYVVGVVALAVVPALREGNVVGAMWRGALLGLLAYATYDLTNLSTIKDWPWQVSAIDLTWGVLLNTMVATAGFYAGRWLGIGS